MNNFDIENYAESLYLRVDEAAVLKQAVIEEERWKPQLNMCHHNVTNLCLLANEYTPVRGWLYFDLPGLDYVKFVAHSAVKTPEGDVFDITPAIASQGYPFLVSNLSEDEYAYIVEDCGHGEINYIVKNA